MKKCTKIFVLLFASLVVPCSTMSLSELEDFANFLKKTSQLDETLKKGTDVNDFDEVDTVSDHAWEESGKFEGDLILNERQRRMIVEDIAEGLSRNGLRDSTKRWPDNELVYYIQKEHFSEGQVQAIQNGIEDLARASCVKFRPYRKGDRDAVVIQGSRRGCFSQVGYQGGYQVLNLSGRHPVGRGCFRHGTVVHELLHSLGFYHMQSSPDRDDYVDIAWENIVQPARHNFRKYNAFAVSDFGVGYDYDSVLHYSRRAFSSNGQDTILPKQGGAQIGQREGLSDKDAQKLNKMYCDADNNDEGNDSTTQKATIKKKIPKNKPFEGQGIGYHQGKTVVIKLVPAAETYYVVNKPAFPMFDYFSKAPQVLSPKEIKNFGRGKQIEESYLTSEGYPSQTHKVIPGFNRVKSIGFGNEITRELKPLNAVSPPNSNQVTQKEDRLETEKGTVENISEVKDGEDLSDAFKRLAKILKTHVYPNHFPDLKAYKINTDYSEFENPETQPRPMDRETSKAYIESLYGNGPDSLNHESRAKTLNPAKILQTSYEVGPTPYKENSKDNDKYIKKLFGEGADTLSPVKKYEKTFDKLKNLKEMYEMVTLDKYKVPKAAEASYRTSYPFREHQNSSHGTLQIETPDYALYENLKDKQNYSSLYLPYTDDNKKINKKYKLLGEYVPTYDDWYRSGIKDHLKRNPVDYDRESYTYFTPSKSNIRIDDASGSSESEPESEDGIATKYTGSFSPGRKEAYTIYGEPVPLTENWYKVNSEKLIDHYPYKYYTTNENSESHEDDRLRK